MVKVVKVLDKVMRLWHTIFNIMSAKDIILKIRKCSLEQLDALRVFTLYDPPIVTTKTISESTSTSDQSLGGVISSLSRIKSETGVALIEPAGSGEDGTRWRLNETLITKDELEKLVEELLGEGLTWAEVPKKVGNK